MMWYRAEKLKNTLNFIEEYMKISGLRSRCTLFENLFEANLLPKP